jgi:surface antigen
MKRGIARRAFSAVAIVLLLAGCATMQGMQQDVENNPKAVLGSLLGAGAGAGIAALAGGNPAVIIGSALAGGLLGGYIGNRLDKRDKQMAAVPRSAPSMPTDRQPGLEPGLGVPGSTTPTKTYQLANGYLAGTRRPSTSATSRSRPMAPRAAGRTWQIQPSMKRGTALIRTISARSRRWPLRRDRGAQQRAYDPRQAFKADTNHDGTIESTSSPRLMTCSSWAT